MKVGLYFGSFNPIHNGHLIIANHVLELATLDEVWFVVSPQNPLKKSESLLNEYNRLYLVQLAIEGNIKFRASNIEFHLPKPSYTVDTLAYLNEKYPDKNFSVIMGSDSYRNLQRWKNYREILNNNQILVYLRPGFPVENRENQPRQIQFLKAPFLDISASYIRQLIQKEKSIQYLVPDEVETYIKGNAYYKKKKK